MHGSRECMHGGKACMHDATTLMHGVKAFMHGLGLMEHMYYSCIVPCHACKAQWSSMAHGFLCMRGNAYMHKSKVA